MSDKNGQFLLIVRYFVCFISNPFNNLPMRYYSRSVFVYEETKGQRQCGMFHHITPLSVNTPTSHPPQFIPMALSSLHLPVFHVNSKLKGIIVQF